MVRIRLLTLLGVALLVSGCTADARPLPSPTSPGPGRLTRISSVIGDGQVVGVGMPLILNFGVDVARDRRAELQKHLAVTSEPAQEGVWNWFSDREVHYRPRTYWQPGTRLALHATVGGMALGGGWRVEKDVDLGATVGAALVMEIDNDTKQMTVTQDGHLLRTIPVSLGKASAPSASGNLVVMAKNPWEWLDGGDEFRVKVLWPQRITWSGQYIYAAPWSEQDQGRHNVSHATINISAAMGQWLYETTHIGDPVIVKNTGSRVRYGDGWTDWEQSWEEYVRGSAR